MVLGKRCPTIERCNAKGKNNLPKKKYEKRNRKCIDGHVQSCFLINKKKFESKIMQSANKNVLLQVNWELKCENLNSHLILSLLSSTSLIAAVSTDWYWTEQLAVLNDGSQWSLQAEQAWRLKKNLGDVFFFSLTKIDEDNTTEAGYLQGYISGFLEHCGCPT